jgi:hypothetical protein
MLPIWPSKTTAFSSTCPRLLLLDTRQQDVKLSLPVLVVALPTDSGLI